VQEAGRRTTSRRELARNERFEDISPELGELDEVAFAEAMEADPDEALGLLADLAGATDERLRALARRLAGKLVVELARSGPARRRSVGKVRRQPYRPDGGDLDIDASVDALAIARAGGAPPDPDELRVRDWVKPGTALCLLVDRSGSMSGRPLATAAVAASAVAFRAPADHSVLAFASDVIVTKSQEVPRPAEQVVNDLLVLRGHGTTDLALAMRAGYAQLERSRAARRIAVLLSDCRATVQGDVRAAAARFDELWVVAPEGDSDDAEELASSVGGRIVTVAGPSGVAEAFAKLAEA
jgi:Mg-chelatase subunit ChlD